MSKVTENISNSFSKANFAVRKHSPEILVGFGIFAVLAGTFLACRATLKAKPVAEKHKKKVAEIREAHAKNPGLYSEKAMNRDITRAYVSTGGELAKLYALPAALEIAGVVSILGSHKILNDRNVATAAYATGLLETLRGYRNRVAEKLGKDEEQELWISQKRKELIEDAEKEKLDEEKKLKKCKKGGPIYSNFSRIFDKAYDGWSENPEFTLYHLKACETLANNKLKAMGHLLLNDVYDMLGYERTKYGCMYGWIYDPTNEYKIDFGLYDLRDPQKARFHDGTEPNIILDFNVDGMILNKLPKE